MLDLSSADTYIAIMMSDMTNTKGKSMTSQDKVVVIRAKAFTGGRIAEQRCSVSQDGTVRVWDDVAGHYTVCHVLSRSAQQKARKLAN